MPTNDRIELVNTILGWDYGPFSLFTPPRADLTPSDWLTGNLIWDRIWLVEFLKTKNVSYFYRKVVFSPHKVFAIVQKTLQCDVNTNWRLHCSSISITHWRRLYGPRGDKFVMRSTGDLIRNRMGLWMHVLVSAAPRPIRTSIVPYDSVLGHLQTA